jgi:hypothetical protein
MPTSAESKPHQRVRCYAAEVGSTHHPRMGAVGKPEIPGGERDYHQLLSHSAFTSVNASCRLESLCRVRVNALNTKALDRQVRFSWVDYCRRRMHSVFEVATP